MAMAVTMATKVALCSPLSSKLPQFTNGSSTFSFPLLTTPRKRASHFKLNAKLGGGGGGGDGDGENKQGSGKKKFITKEQEPEQYWQTAGEREGENPMMTPLPYIIIFGMSTPFIILAIAFLNGWIKVPVR